jgi:hypothetical protein
MNKYNLNNINIDYLLLLFIYLILFTLHKYYKKYAQLSIIFIQLVDLYSYKSKFKGYVLSCVPI